MFEQDYLLRMISEVIRVSLKVFFNIDSDSNSYEMITIDESKNNLNVLKELTDMVDAGNINDAENILFETMDKGNMSTLKMALLFYSHLNDKDDDFLIKNDFSREEITLGLNDTMHFFGVDSIAKLLLSDIM